MLKIVKRIIVPLIVLIIFGVLAYVVVSNPPTLKKFKPDSAAQLNVEVKTIHANDLVVNIESYGTVKPRTQSMLFAQVSGQIISISEKFREGGFFEKGDSLVELDQRDLLSAIQIAKSELFTAEQELEEEKARVAQALQDWKRLSNGNKASDLVLRKPQLMSAEAKVLSAKASVDNAKLALERSSIKAPYTGRVLQKLVDVGQVVSSNTTLAEIYAVDYVEIRLPIKNKDLPYIDLPEVNRFNNQVNSIENPHVNFYSDLIGKQEWQGEVVRTEGALDSNSQQLFVVAQINDPYSIENTLVNPIKIGQYVTANIKGKTIENAITIPNQAIYQGSYVYIVEDGILKRKTINIIWQNKAMAVVDNGLIENDLLVLTPLGQVNSGMRVQVSKVDGIDKKPLPRKNKGEKGKKHEGGNKEKKQKGDKPKPEQNNKGEK